MVHSPRRWTPALLALFTVAALLVAPPGAGSSNPAPAVAPPAAAPSLSVWAVFDGDGQRSGINARETLLTADTAGQLQQLWHISISAADSAPVYLANVATSQGNKSLVYVTAHTGSLLALDVDNGHTVWQRDTSGPSNITTSSPAIDATDPAHPYVYSYGLDGKVHKYAAGSGDEALDSNWPLVATILPSTEKGSSALNLADGYLYVTTSGYNGDATPYVGHVVGRNLTTNATSVFNVLCSDLQRLLGADDCPSQQAGVWARAGTVVDPGTGHVLLATGNGPYGTGSHGMDYGDSIVELSADLSQVLDSYTPSNYQNLQDTDRDLGSTAPALLPAQAGSSTPHLAVQGGKDNTLRLLNLQDLSGQGGPNHVGGELQSVGGICGEIKGQPVAWTDGSNQTRVFVTDDCDNLYAYKVVTSDGQTRLQLSYQKGGIGHTSPLLVNGVLYVEAGGGVHAVAATSGHMLWTGTIGGVHWQSPLVASGRLYVPDDDGGITAFALPSPTVTGVNPAFGPRGGGTRVTLTGTGFTDATAVRFGTTAADPASLEIDSDWQLSVTSPKAGRPGTVRVTVTADGRTSPANAPADQFSFAPVWLASVSPASGAPLSRVTIGGYGFAAGTTIRFVFDPGVHSTADLPATAAETTPASGGPEAAAAAACTLASCSVYAQSVACTRDGTSCTGSVPPVPIDPTTQQPFPDGTVANIVVSVGAQQSPPNHPADQFTYAAPTLGAVSPPTGPPGTQLRLSGTGFPGSGLTASFVFQSSVKHQDLTVQVRVPKCTSDVICVVTVPPLPKDPDAQPPQPFPLGTLAQVSVTVGGLTSSATASFTYARPAVTTVDPNQGVGGVHGTRVTLTGTGFGTKNTTTVDFVFHAGTTGKPDRIVKVAPVDCPDGTRCSVVAPHRPAGYQATADVTVTVGTGAGAVAGDLNPPDDQFTYSP